jgi:pimeloyl-ACP methyl ester carboxylesterase
MKRLNTSVLFLILFMFCTSVFSQTYFKVEVQGKGKPMILIHGLYCTSDVWKETVERYKKDYECHVLTLAGFGGNPANLNETFLQSVKDDLLAYIKTKKLNKPVLMGHSMGGFISFWTAASAPSTFSKVIAVDGLPFLTAVQMPGVTAEGAKPMAENMRKQMSNTQSEEQTEATQKMILSSMITSPERINQVAAIGKKSDNKTQAQVMYEMFTTDLRQTVAAIDCPVLLLGAWIAYKDYGVTHESITAAYTAQVAAIKNAKVEITDTGKHFIFYDEPVWFYEKVDAFLK